jgi:hypothetical protein
MVRGVAAALGGRRRETHRRAVVGVVGRRVGAEVALPCVVYGPVSVYWAFVKKTGFVVFTGMVVRVWIGSQALGCT